MNFQDLPNDLPVPEDDGGTDYLPGMRLPALLLPSTKGGKIDLSSLGGLTVCLCLSDDWQAWASIA